MIGTLKTQARNVLSDSFVWDSYPADLLRRVRNDRQLASWEKEGKRLPPPGVVKRRILAAYATAFNPRTFIETGTYLGQTTYAMKDYFQSIYSIELNEHFANKAKHRFRAHSHMQILQGDSGQRLPELLGKISETCLFWLDGHYGHYSGTAVAAKADLETPVMNEVRAILNHKVKDHVILIDDARCFDGTHDYPTMSELRALIESNRPNYDYSVQNDVIRIHPRRVVDSKY
jgi:hypothetical protein